MMARNGQNLTVALGPRGRELYSLRDVAQPLMLALVLILVANSLAVVNVVIFAIVSILGSLDCASLVQEIL